MNRLIVPLTPALLAICFLFEVSAAQQPTQSTPTSAAGEQTITRLAPGTTLRVELEKSVDAKKARPGDVIVAKTMDDLLSGNNTVVAPKGLKVIGHVTAATAHEHESPSTLGVVFDKLIWKDGTEIPLNATIQALGKPESYANAPADTGGGQMQPGNAPMGNGNARGGMSPGGGIPPGGAYPPSGSSGGEPTQPSGNPTGQLSPNAQGVVGMSGVTLAPGTAHDSVISSQKHNVKLDGGTQIVLRVS